MWLVIRLESCNSGSTRSLDSIGSNIIKGREEVKMFSVFLNFLREGGQIQIKRFALCALPPQVLDPGRKALVQPEIIPPQMIYEKGQSSC